MKSIEKENSIENLNLNNTVVAIIDSQELESTLADLNDLNIDENTIRVISPQDAKKIADVSSDNMSFLNKIKRTLDKYIGGGTAEFLRDVKNIGKNQSLVVIEIKDDDEKDKLFSVLKHHFAHRLKYFNPLYVEHGTFEKDHGKEM